MKIEIKLKKFLVPNFVLLESKPQPRQDGFFIAPDKSFPLSDLNYDTLDELCTTFRREAFEKANLVDVKPKNEPIQ